MVSDQEKEMLEEDNLTQESPAQGAQEGAQQMQEGVQQMQEDQEVSQEPDPGMDKKEAKAFKKKAKADKKQDALKEKIEELEDRVKRQMAEFDNFRKRTDKEKTMMFETGAKSIIEKILPVVDNFERGLQALSEEEKKEPFAEGMAMVYKQLIQELEGLGVKPIEAIGHEFDPELHNAVLQVESEEYEEGIVAEELQKGYLYRDGVVRHSMVAVVRE